MEKCPKVIIGKEKSDAQHVKDLLEIYDKCMYLPFNEETIYTFHQTLESLSHYVTLIKFNESNGFGVVNIGLTIQILKDTLKNQRR